MPAKIPVDKYLKADLFEEIGLKTLTPEERVSFLEGFGNVLQYRLTFRLMEEMTEEQKKELDGVLADNSSDPATIVKHLNTALPDFGKIAEEEVAKYKKELIERFKA